MTRLKINKSLWFVLVIIHLALAFAAYSIFFRRADPSAAPDRLVVPLTVATSTTRSLVDRGFVTSGWPIHLALIMRGRPAFIIEPGGYRISKSQTPWEIAGVLTERPYMRWVVLKEGLRKEEIGEILTSILGWTEEQKKRWLAVSTVPDSARREGVYFPDTYLIPLAETPDEVALRMRRRFDEKFAPLAKEAAKKNIKWTTAVTLASLIQREAAGKQDMALISGVLWNRLDVGMKLDVDATLQYARGNTGAGWWAPITPEEKKIDSPFNTYIHKGLPPHPIANPGLDALSAAINPETTECFYYLHASKQIYCAETFEEHKENIEKYLRK